jgi:adenylate kinase
MRDFVLFGPPGSGKGTQAALLVERLGHFHLSTGRLLREAMSAGSALGLRAEQRVAAGGLVDDTTVNAIVREALADLPPATKAVLFDGYPRSVAQAKELDCMLQRVHGHGVDLVILLEVDDRDVIRRLAGRRECADCGAIYNIHTDPLVDPSQCKVCGGELLQRPDDNAEAIRHRLFLYHRETKPILDHYAGEGVLASVDARQPVEVIHEILVRAIERKFGQGARV